MTAAAEGAEAAAARPTASAPAITTAKQKVGSVILTPKQAPHCHLLPLPRLGICPAACRCERRGREFACSITHLRGGAVTSTSKVVARKDDGVRSMALEVWVEECHLACVYDDQLTTFRPCIHTVVSRRLAANLRRRGALLVLLHLRHCVRLRARIPVPFSLPFSE